MLLASAVRWLCHVQDATRLQKEVFEFSPAAEGLPAKHINLLLCGGVGAGKSSIVSTVDSLCQGRISRRAPHGQGTGSLTRQLRKYGFINPASKRKVQWQLWDSMGWGASEYKQGELGFILDGNLPNKCKLDGSISLKTEGFNKRPSIADAVHCVCFVVPCDAASDDSYMARLREMRQFARDRGKHECLNRTLGTAWKLYVLEPKTCKQSAHAVCRCWQGTARPDWCCVPQSVGQGSAWQSACVCNHAFAKTASDVLVFSAKSKIQSACKTTRHLI